MRTFRIVCTITAALAMSPAAGQKAQKPGASFVKGEESFHRLNFPRAIAYYERHLSYRGRRRGDTTDMRAFAQLARAHWNIRDYAGAARWLDSLPRQLLLSDADLLRKRAELHAIHGRYDSAHALMSLLRGFEARAAGFLDPMRFFKDSADWRLGYAVVNTRMYNEFSPLVYGGLVMWSTNEPLFTTQRSVSGWDGKSFFRQAYVDQELEMLQSSPQPLKGEGSMVPPPRARRLAQTYGLSENSLREPALPAGGRGSILTMSERFRELGGLFSMDFNVGHATACTATGRVYFSANQEGRITEGAVRTLRIVEADVSQRTVTATRFLQLAPEDSIAIHPAIHPGGGILVYSAMRKGGGRDYDLYLTHRDSSGKWSTPQPITALNTPGNEVFASFDPEGTLYFSSDGRPGPGGLDIHRAPLLADGSFGRVTTMPYPLNSSRDDFGWTEVNGSAGRGYLTSNRYGSDDILGFRRDIPDVQIRGAVVDASTGLRLSGIRVSVYLVEADGVTRTPVGEVVSDEKGNYAVPARPERSYEVRLTNPGDSDAVSGKPQVHQVYTDRENAWVSASPLFVGRYRDAWVDANRIPMKDERSADPALDTLFLLTDAGLRNASEVSGNRPKDLVSPPGDRSDRRVFIVNFDFDSDEVDQIAENTIQELMAWLRVYPHSRLMLFGHTDVEGSDEYNRDLSARRAANVRQRVMELGYPGERIGTDFFGERQPRVQTRRKNEARTNRRVEVYILR